MIGPIVTESKTELDRAAAWRFFVPVVRHYRLSGKAIFEAWRSAESAPTRALAIYRTLANDIGLDPVAPWAGLDLPFDRTLRGLLGRGA